MRQFTVTELPVSLHGEQMLTQALYSVLAQRHKLQLERGCMTPSKAASAVAFLQRICEACRASSASPHFTTLSKFTLLEAFKLIFFSCLTVQGIHYIDEAGLELAKTPLTLPPKCWGYKLH